MSSADGSSYSCADAFWLFDSFDDFLNGSWSEWGHVFFFLFIQVMYCEYWDDDDEDGKFEDVVHSKADGCGGLYTAMRLPWSHL